MSWTTDGKEANELLQNDVMACMEYHFEAMFQALQKGIDYPDESYESCISAFFNSIQPTQEEYLQFLKSRGFDTEKFQSNFFAKIKAVEIGQKESQIKAETFFQLFQTEWHVSQEQVNEFITEGSIYFLLELAVSDAASTKARLNAIKRHALSPKQEDKAKVRECWDAWQANPLNPDGTKKYSGKSAFALDMLRSWEHLQNQRVITNWCLDWERDAKEASS
ncbi:MAG: hypothetical protein WAV85_02870 [Rhodoferax sp.]